MKSADNHEGRRASQIFAVSGNFIPCMAWILLLLTYFEFLRIRGALILDVLARWSVDLLQVFLPTAGLLPELLKGPGYPAACGAWTVNHKRQTGFFMDLVFASGFFEGKPRSKKQK
jgi:hypothetical protein